MAEPFGGVHDEPYCTDIQNGCFYPEPHKHGFACDRECKECFGQCHPSCPQYPTHMSPIAPSPEPKDNIMNCKGCGHEHYYHYKGGRCQVTGCSCRRIQA